MNGFANRALMEAVARAPKPSAHVRICRDVVDAMKEIESLPHTPGSTAYNLYAGEIYHTRITPHEETLPSSLRTEVGIFRYASPYLDAAMDAYLATLTVPTAVKKARK